MGMAASQARLLTITARLADNELRSQTINNAKMRLATQSSQASENYINALNDATMMFSNYDLSGNATSQALTFNALTSYSSYNTQYGLVDASGRLLVSESEAAMFEASHGNLNAYLKSHGLEFTTTYFDELGAMKNDKYPAPFNDISTDEMKDYYERYGSYENSIEVERYEESYSKYRSASNLLSNAAEDSMKKYLVANSNNPVLKNDSGIYSFDLTSQGSIQDAYNLFINSLIGSNNNTYNIENLHNQNFITDDTYNAIKGTLNNFSMTTDNAGNPALKYGEPIEYNVETDNEAGTKTYTFYDAFTITTDLNGAVIAGAQQLPATDYTISVGSKDSGGLPTDNIWSYLNALKLDYNETDDDGNPVTNTFYYDCDYTGNIKEYTLYTNIDEAKDLLNDAIDTIYAEVYGNANFEAFTKWLLDPATLPQLGSYGINPNEKIEKAGNNTLTEVLNNYTSTKADLIRTIFEDSTPVTIDGVTYNSSYEYIDQALSDGTIDAQLLTEVDLVLQLIKDKGLIQSPTYETVIKEYIIDEMITLNGEPKYAWVDENDTGNTGNADSKAQWYTNLFQRMTKGYKAIENGLANSKEWIEYALETGIVSMEQVDKSYNWQSLDYKTCTRITEETDNDAVTKAEAEYTRAMNDIEAKDNIYDIELKNIDTEHTSLQTEYDSIKSVISKNIDRTFKFNQSA